MTERRVIAIVGNSNAALIAAALRVQPKLLTESMPCHSFSTDAQREAALSNACVAAVAKELGV